MKKKKIKKQKIINFWKFFLTLDKKIFFLISLISESLKSNANHLNSLKKCNFFLYLMVTAGGRKKKRNHYNNNELQHDH